MRTAAPILLISACLASCLASCVAARSVDPPNPHDLATTYTSLRPMTKDPVFVEPALALLCRGVTPDDIVKARAAAGPHALTTVRIYMNDTAAEAFGTPSVQYPVGSVIVKEKAALSLASRGIESLDAPRGGHDGVGGMIKRAPGYDPANGDWEYFYFEDASAVESGRIASCIACHRGAADRDFVFGDWARESARTMHGG